MLSSLLGIIRGLERGRPIVIPTSWVSHHPLSSGLAILSPKSSVPKDGLDSRSIYIKALFLSLLQRQVVHTSPIYPSAMVAVLKCLIDVTLVLCSKSILSLARFLLSVI